MKGTKTGGRQKGTPNKTTSTIRAWIVELINGNRDLFAADLQQLEPLKRLEMLEKLLKYILPQHPDAKAVEGAAYDVGNACIAETDMFGNYTYGVREWYEPRNGNQWSRSSREKFVGTDSNFEGYPDPEPEPEEYDEEADE